MVSWNTYFLCTGNYVIPLSPCFDLNNGNRSTKFDVLSAWTQNGVDKIDIRKSIIDQRILKNRHKEIDHPTCHVLF